MPSGIRAGTELMVMMNSSKSVEARPLGSSLGTGEKSLPRAEYWGTRLLSPPLWITRIRRPEKSPRPVTSAI